LSQFTNKMSNKLLIAVFLILGLNSIFCEKFRYNGYTVLRIRPQTQQQLDYLKDLSENNFELDFWTYPSIINRTVDLMVPPHLKQSIDGVFRQKSYNFQTMIDDVERLLEEQRLEQEIKTRDEAIPGFWDKFQPLDIVFQFIDAIVTQNSGIASQQVIGKSTENRDLKLLIIGVPGTNKPIIFIDATIHAREWITTSTTTWFIQQLVDGYNSNNAEIVNLLTTFDFHIVPVLNPDGYVFSHTNTRLWRKTRSANSGSTCIGTDPNRNYNHNWTVAGASTNPCSETYAGRAPFSEPETKAVSDYILTISSRTKLYIAMHSYSQLLLSPWGYTSALPPNNADLVAKSAVFVNAIKQDYGTTYTAGTTTNVLYAASGNQVDWAYGVANILQAYTVELRDTGTYGFVLPVSQIKPSGIETTRALIALCSEIAKSL
jgi:murein tripeptide amidase MpaA